MTEFGICAGCGGRMARTADEPVCLRPDCGASAIRVRMLVDLRDDKLCDAFPGSAIERPEDEGGGG